MPALSAQQQASQYRLFMVPGMDHCGGGEGASQFDTLGTLDAWATSGKAPERIVATRPTARRRPSGRSRRPAARADVAPAVPVPDVRAVRWRGRRRRCRELRCVAPSADRRRLTRPPCPGPTTVPPCAPPASRASGCARWSASRAASRAGSARSSRSHPDGSITGSLADGCLEKQLASEVAAATGPAVKRFGAGSELIDFRLPCGSGLDVLIDPEPDRDLCRAAVERLDRREEAVLVLPAPGLPMRHYIPALRLQLFGEGPELDALVALAAAAGVEAARARQGRAVARTPPAGLSADPWTAAVLLFHDHEWEQAILEWALATPAFYLGAQGGFEARRTRLERLAANGAAPEQLARIRSPIGAIAHSREPGVLALSVLAEIVGAYEALHPHG